MKKFLKVLAVLSIPMMTVSCSRDGGSSTATGSSKTAESGSTASSVVANTSSNVSIVTEWEEGWTYDDTNHWHASKDGTEKKDVTAHTFGEWKTENLGTKLNDHRFDYSNVKYKECSVCHAIQVDSTHSVLPEIRFNIDPADPNQNFATVAKSTDTTRPKVNGTITITNGGSYNTTEPLVATMKVRGNQTAGFDKKGLQINFDSKQKLFGLNGDQEFKKWVLLGDAKDTTISRSALGLTMAKGIIASDSKVWATDFTPVSVYINDQYWGMYMLAEQKEVKDGRIKLPEVGKKDTSVNIGYSFELDYYARNEAAKGADGDPTFEINYGNYFTQQSYNIESCLANSGLGIVKTYTMNSDIKDSTAGETEQTNATNSNQVAWIKNRLQALFNVLAEASKNKVAKDIDADNQVIAAPSGTTLKQAIEKHFDLNAWAEGFIINAVCLPPDVGYSSFYMSFDNSADGDKKLRFDNPWDFDSNFGNRRGFIEQPDVSNGGKDPYFMDRTANMWLQFLGKMDFFMNDYVKPKWNTARQNGVFEDMMNVAKTYYAYYDGEYAKNFTKWTTTQASDQNVANYFNGDGVRSGELRKPFVNVNERKDAQKETLNWLAKRVNYLENKWVPNSTRTPLPTTK